MLIYYESTWSHGWTSKTNTPELAQAPKFFGLQGTRRIKTMIKAHQA